MKVAWVTHHIPKVEDRPSALLPGKYAGGAERNNDYMVGAAPAHVEVQWIGPDEWDHALDRSFDRIVVTGTDLLDEQAIGTLAAYRPIVWIQHHQHGHPQKPCCSGKRAAS